MPRMTHPDSDQTIEVDEDQVPLYAAQGWQEKTSTAKSTAKKSS